MYYLLTNDVEEHSIQKNRLDDETAREVSKVGIPRLLDLYAKQGIRATFFFTGTFVERFPDSARAVKDAGHEVGCHGLTHMLERALDELSYSEQLSDIRQAKAVIEREVGEIQSFRAPALRINSYTMKILEELGFRIDSSVASQRFDGPFSFGSRRKLNWLFTKRKPYFTDYNNPYKQGESEILEIPISAFLFPHIGTFMRISPAFDKILSRVLLFESVLSGKPVVFDIHPNECIYEIGDFSINRRTRNFFSYFFADLLRANLKKRNLGKKAVRLLESEIVYAKQHGFKFVTCSEFREIYENIHNDNG